MNKKTITVLSTAAALILISAIVFQIALRPKNQIMNNQNNDINKDQPTIEDIETGGTGISFRAVDKYFCTRDNDKWIPNFLKGVNMGLTEATTDLTNPNVTYDTYMEWFTLIGEMNANTVKVYTIMPPQFYKAFFDYNNKSQKTLYLLQGIWFNENYMNNFDDAFSEDEMIGKAFKLAAKETVDIIHGNSDYTDYGEIKNAVYDKDISKYLAGYILGLEWEYGFVVRTNRLTDKIGFNGKYLYTSDSATAFESFLAGVGDYLIDYQTEKYGFQTPIAFLNWSTTDTLTHTNEPFSEEDAVSVNTENILSKNSFYCGQFAAIDIYPYYPEFINHQPEYNSPDENGNMDSYKAYLKDLKKEYSVPVIVAEFGVPTSRGVAHTSSSNMNQGGITEKQQGEYVVSMMCDIAETDYAGGMIFSWQDEWFKQTWNTYKYSSDIASTRTPNVQSAEQSYGILAMEPGKEPICLLDGKKDEWENQSTLVNTDGVLLKTKYDEGYLYLNLEIPEFDFAKETVYIPIQISGLGSLESKKYGLKFSEAVDFILVINGENNTRVMTDAYEDLFNYMYSIKRGVFPQDKNCKIKNSGVYNPIRQFLSNEIVLPLTNEVIEPKFTESGLLTYGISDESHKDFNSLADFYCKGNTVEIRIPWYLLNVMNSTVGVRLNNFANGSEINIDRIKNIKVGVSRIAKTPISLYNIGYKTNELSNYHTRLKKSYDIITNGLETLPSADGT